MSVTFNGYPYTVVFYTRRFPDRVTEYAKCRELGKLGSYSWCNRPWQEFEYAGAMKELARKVGKDNPDLGDAFYKQLFLGEETEVRKECETMMSNFKSAYNSLSDNGKRIMAESGVTLNSKEDVKSVTAIMQLGALLGV